MVIDVSEKWHECGVCKSKYITKQEAEKCERSHKLRGADIGDIWNICYNIYFWVIIDWMIIFYNVRVEI